MLEDEGATAEVEKVTDEVQSKSIDDTIRDTLRTIRERDSETPEPVIKTDAVVGQEPKQRDDQGKFVAKPPVAGEAQVEQAPVAEDPPPQSWKKEVAASWAALPPEVRAEVARREADFHKGIEQYKTAAQFAQQMQQIIAPHEATIRGLGVTPEVAIKELLQADHRLRYGTPQQKQQYFAHLAQSYGIDLKSVGEMPAQDPNLSAFQQELEQLRGVVQQQQTLSQKREQESLNSEISRFASDPTHSHFEMVKGHMAALLQAGQAKDLSDAYEQAVFANPQTRALVLAEQQAKERAEAAKKAQAAKAAASVNTPRRPSMPPSQPIGSMDETIRQTLRKLQAA